MKRPRDNQPWQPASGMQIRVVTSSGLFSHLASMRYVASPIEKPAIDLFSDEAKGGLSLQAVRVKQCSKESLERETTSFGLQCVEGVEVTSER